MRKKDRDFELTCERYVAFFDILGFKNMVYREPHDEIYFKLHRFIKKVEGLRDSENFLLFNAQNTNFDIDKGIVMPVVFSDSIVLISNSDSIHCFNKILFASSMILAQSLSNNIPIKGAIAFGLFTSNFHNSLFFGRPLIDAYILTSELHFLGAALHHSIEQNVSKYDLDLADDFLFNGDIPLKKGHVQHYYIDWTCLLEEAIETDKLDIAVEVILDNLYLTASGSDRLYIDNSKRLYLEDEQLKC